MATNGSDTNSGTSATAAWRTVGKAVASLHAGQTGCVHAGTYDSGTLDVANSGAPNAPIALIGAPGEARPMVRSTSDSTLLSFGPRDAYRVVKGLDLNKNQRAVNRPSSRHAGLGVRPQRGAGSPHRHP